MELIEDFHRKLFVAQTKHLYEQSIITMLYNIPLISIVVAVLWFRVPLHTLVIGWFFIALVSCLRYFQAKMVLTKARWDSLSIIRRNLRYHAFFSFLGGTSWGVAFILYAVYLYLPGQLFMLLVLAGVSSAAIVPLSSFTSIYSFYIVPMFTIPCYFLFFSFPHQNIPAVFVIVLYAIVQIATVQRNSRLTSRSLRLQLEKDTLIETLSEKNKRIHLLSQLDELTQLPNRRFLFEVLEKEFHRAERENTNLALFMMDIDYFKLYNDHYGHLAGDKILSGFAHVLQNTFQRAGDFVARYGGEEFIAVLPNSNEEAATLMANRLISNLQEAALEHAYSEVGPYITISIGGIVLMPHTVKKIDEIIAEADKLLYEAKEEGRNQFKIKILHPSSRAL